MLSDLSWYRTKWSYVFVSACFPSSAGPGPWSFSNVTFVYDYSIPSVLWTKPNLRLGTHITNPPQKCSTRKTLQQQLQRPAPKPLGTTTQPRLRTRDASSQSQRATHLQMHVLTSPQCSSRSFSRQPHYFDAHSHPLRTAPC
jgi:hypothetical protein